MSMQEQCLPVLSALFRPYLQHLKSSALFWDSGGLHSDGRLMSLTASCHRLNVDAWMAECSTVTVPLAQLK